MCQAYNGFRLWSYGPSEKLINKILVITYFTRVMVCSAASREKRRGRRKCGCRGRTSGGTHNFTGGRTLTSPERVHTLSRKSRPTRFGRPMEDCKTGTSGGGLGTKRESRVNQGWKEPVIEGRVPTPQHLLLSWTPQGHGSRVHLEVRDRSSRHIPRRRAQVPVSPVAPRGSSTTPAGASVPRSLT